MLYKAIGLMSGSSLDGLDIAYVYLEEISGEWTYDIQHAACYPYEEEWTNRLRDANRLPAYDYQLLHTAFGQYLGKAVNRFISGHNLQFQVQLISSHGHTVFHDPKRKMTAQLGSGAAIAAETGIPVVTDLRAMDIALGGQGAPIVPVGEKRLLGTYCCLLNLGGIANLTVNRERVQSGQSPEAPVGTMVAFDVCPANRVLNMLAAERGLAFDRNGELASAGRVNQALLEKLNAFSYYADPYPKSLANEFGTTEIYPLLQQEESSLENKLCTYVRHICEQVKHSVCSVLHPGQAPQSGYRLLVTGGGARNGFLVEGLKQLLSPLQVEVVIADDMLVDFKEAMIMAFIGVLRWRDEVNILSSVTGASRDCVGGALWMGA